MANKKKKHITKAQKNRNKGKKAKTIIVKKRKNKKKTKTSFKTSQVLSKKLANETSKNITNTKKNKIALKTPIKEKKLIKKKKIILIIILLISLSVVTFSLGKIFIWNKDNQDIKKIEDNISDVATERPSEDAVNVNPPVDKSDDYWDYIKMDMMSVNFNELKKKNPDTVGFIKVNGTNINYPVVQTTDNDYYLNHAFDKSENDAGWIFADYRNNMVTFDKNTIIYGHGRLNNTMFGTLKNITDSSWYDNKNNYIVKFSTPTENTLWQVFSIYTIPTESYYLQTEFNSDSEYNNFLQELKNRSVKNFSAEVNSNDKIITLSTCKDVAGTKRVVMHAKLIKIEAR